MVYDWFFGIIFIPIVHILKRKEKDFHCCCSRCMCTAFGFICTDICICMHQFLSPCTLVQPEQGCSEFVCHPFPFQHSDISILCWWFHGFFWPFISIEINHYVCLSSNWSTTDGWMLNSENTFQGIQASEIRDGFPNGKL